MKTIVELKAKFEELEAQIAETKKRLPAHSVKPPVMKDLLDLEDQYDDIAEQIQKLQAKDQNR